MIELTRAETFVHKYLNENGPHGMEYVSKVCEHREIAGVDTAVQGLIDKGLVVKHDNGNLVAVTPDNLPVNPEVSTDVILRNFEKKREASTRLKNKLYAKLAKKALFEYRAKRKAAFLLWKQSSTNPSLEDAFKAGTKWREEEDEGDY